MKVRVEVVCLNAGGDEQRRQVLTIERRELAIDYYRDARREKIERRRQIAGRLGISMNALAIRASRIRDALERCVRTCCSEP